MEVNNLTQFVVDKDLLLKIVSTVLEEEKSTEKSVSVALVDPEKMRELNKAYREKDYATDVLSFFYNEKDFLGEVVLCPEVIENKAEKSSFTKEICRVTIHGVLHLLDYTHERDDDERVMIEKTEYYLKIFHNKL